MKEQNLCPLGIADAVLLLNANELDQAISWLEPTVLVLGNEFKDNAKIQSSLSAATGGSLRPVPCRDIHYATAELLSGSERDLRQQRHPVPNCLPAPRH